MSSLAFRRDCEVKCHIHWRISWDCAVAARMGLSYSAILRGSSVNKICVCTVRVHKQRDLGLKQPRNIS